MLKKTTVRLNTETSSASKRHQGIVPNRMGNGNRNASRGHQEQTETNACEQNGNAPPRPHMVNVLAFYSTARSSGELEVTDPSRPSAHYGRTTQKFRTASPGEERSSEMCDAHVNQWRHHEAFQNESIRESFREAGVDIERVLAGIEHDMRVSENISSNTLIRDLASYSLDDVHVGEDEFPKKTRH